MRVITVGDYTDASGRRWRIERIDKKWAWLKQDGTIAIPVAVAALERLPTFRRIACKDQLK